MSDRPTAVLLWEELMIKLGLCPPLRVACLPPVPAHDLDALRADAALLPQLEQWLGDVDETFVTNEHTYNTTPAREDALVLQAKLFSALAYTGVLTLALLEPLPWPLPGDEWSEQHMQEIRAWMEPLFPLPHPEELD